MSKKKEINIQDYPIGGRQPSRKQIEAMKKHAEEVHKKRTPEQIKKNEEAAEKFRKQQKQ